MDKLYVVVQSGEVRGRAQFYSSTGQFDLLLNISLCSKGNI